MTRKKRGLFEVRTGDHSPELSAFLRGWLSPGQAEGRGLESHLARMALRPDRPAAEERQRHRNIAKGLATFAVGVAALPAFELLRHGKLSGQSAAFLIASVVAAGLSGWSWRASRHNRS